ncbi:DUF4214 domain-containing protein [Noviherbaspirillum sp. CPCC 100848]|uniref:DUF4214 domain-containing protein n=1 Tax=Noviherbaspirillum album TaxID=3080276 RepID=A0ABU6J2G9_9BURK|nr:DUF4214 domain-containing protein [Noviherbaspirillum sp. CPCC 100848]MEC4717818.1 DUF4214 domain-containing protein [Noviherbaspirillum sp. CPCC 100848]
MLRNLKAMPLACAAVLLAACGGGSDADYGSSSVQLRPTMYLDDGRVVNSCSVEPRCTGQYLVVPGSHTASTIARTPTGATITSAQGTTINALAHNTRLVFVDGTVALDIDGNAGQVYRLYQAAFNRSPDLPGLGFWIYMMDSEAIPTVSDLAGYFYQSPEFKSIYGTAPSNVDLVTRYYRNALQREPDASGLAFWVDLLNRGVMTPAQVLAAFSESPENRGRVLRDIRNGILYAPYSAAPQPQPNPPQPNPPVTAGVTMAPDNGATVSGTVRLEIRGSGIANAELLPPNGYAPRLGVFSISPDRTLAWLDFDTTTLPNGAADLRISAFNVAAGQPDAVEVIAMPARRWQVSNAGTAPAVFNATLAAAPANGASIAGVTRLEVRGSGIGNVELLPATGYTPRLGVFNVTADRSYAWLDFDTRALPNGPLDVRISAFNVAAGQPGAVEIVPMDPRRWNISNGSTAPVPVPFTANLTVAPPGGAVLTGVTRLEVTGSGLANVELLPATGYAPRLGVFNVSSDGTRAWLDFDTRGLPNGPLEARISAFNVGAGQPGAQEIVAMPARTWQLQH